MEERTEDLRLWTVPQGLGSEEFNAWLDAVIAGRVPADGEEAAQ